MQSEAPELVHAHRCGDCGIHWLHSHNMVGDINAHACPGCGKKNWLPMVVSTFWRLYYNVNAGEALPVCLDHGPMTERKRFAQLTIRGVECITRFNNNVTPKMWVEVPKADLFSAGDKALLLPVKG